MISKQVIQKEEVTPGDIFICYTQQERKDYSKTGYAHVAIVISPSEILHSDSKGVNTCTIDNLLEDYDHIAVMRAGNEIWTPDRILILEEFSRKSKGKSFNFDGLKACRAAQDSQSMRFLEITDDMPNISGDRDFYFCSELVVSIFLEAGIIDFTASFLFSPEKQLPIDVLKDKLYGCFIGYIFFDDKYSLPADDYFLTRI